MFVGALEIPLGLFMSSFALTIIDNAYFYIAITWNDSLIKQREFQESLQPYHNLVVAKLLTGVVSLQIYILGSLLCMLLVKNVHAFTVYLVQILEVASITWPLAVTFIVLYVTSITKVIRESSHIDFVTYCVIMTQRTCPLSPCYLCHVQIFDKINSFPKKIFNLFKIKKGQLFLWRTVSFIFHCFTSQFFYSSFVDCSRK